MYKEQSNVLIIDLMTNDVESVTDLILQCRRIISSSLHGIIISQAYHIPAVWVKFSDNVFGDGIKYQDYFESVDIENYAPKFVSEKLEDSQTDALFNAVQSTAAPERIKEIQDGLMEACPFK
ncbi:Polysaccharide pyruvyl transferase [compost metagenome]